MRQFSVSCSCSNSALPLAGSKPMKAHSWGFRVILEFVMSEHSIQGISTYRHRLHLDKVSDKESQINPNPQSKMPKLQAGC